MRTTRSEQLDQLSRRAARSARRRLNLNLHPTLDDPVQRFFNCLEPGSYVQPHRHTAPSRWEMFVALRGRAVVLEFDDAGRVTARCEISPEGPAVAVEIDGEVWHTVAALSPGTTLFELKPGPYSPVADKCFASWAPAEDDPGRSEWAAWFAAAVPGDARPARCRRDDG
jgi:cupin fold WbuC family metalloprotein